MLLCASNHVDQFTTLVGVLLSTLGSALGALIGGMLFFRYRAKLEKEIKAPQFVNEYFPGKATSQKEGVLVQAERGLGKILSEHDKLKALGLENSVFEFDSLSVPLILPPDKDRYIFYGPYNADLSRRGKYGVKFTITGLGFNESASHEIKESVILMLDVVRWVSMGAVNGSAQDTFSNKYLKYKDFLGSNKQNKFELYLYSQGTGIWEYRAILSERIFEVLKLMNAGNEKFAIYFEKIEITYYPEISYPW